MSSLDFINLAQAMKNSWKRCQNYGLKPTDTVNDHVLTGSSMREIVDQHEPLIQHTDHLFAKMHHFIKQSGQVALLIDAQGTIIHAVGDPDFTSRAQRVQLQVGANWEERRKGTNAIGLALTEKVPVRVHADEHFYASNRFLTCASSPVFSPTGELIAVINISGKHEHYHESTWMMACLAAESLQNRLLLEEARKEQLITLKELDLTAQKVPMPLISLDRDNRIVRANQAALRVVGKDAIGKPFAGVNGFAVETIHDAERKVWRSVAVQKQLEKPGHRQRLHTFEDMFGACPQLLQRKELACKAAQTSFSVLLLGESGTGKEWFAQSIHSASPRADRPFIAVNCSAIPDSLVESELFGYERGAFTGANREGSIGKFEAAHGGTIFLDEIGDMSLRAQAALLRVLQEHTVTPVGSTRSKRIDTRLIAATHRNLTEEVRAGRFRADLYYRLKGIQLTLPPLRERSDLPALALHLLREHGYDCGREVFTEAAQHKLLGYHWPGNLRELNSVLVQAVFLADGEPIDAKHLQLEEAEACTAPLREAPAAAVSLKEAEVEAIKQALRASGGNLSKAAGLLQIGRTTLYRKIEEYGIAPF